MSLYDSFNLTNSEYVPEFVGAPLDAVKQTGDVLASRHYENIAKEHQLELLARQQKANTEPEADKAYIDHHIRSIQSALSDIAQNGGENATARVGALANQFLGDEGLINIQKNSAAMQKEKDTMDQLRSQGHSPLRNEAYAQQFRQQGSFDPESGTWKSYNGTAQPQLDYVKSQDTIVDPLQADISQSDLTGDIKTSLNNLGAHYSGDLGNMSTQLKTQVIKELSSRKVRGYIDKYGFDNYKQTPEYKQQKEILGLSDEQIKHELTGRGEAKVFQAISKDWTANKAFDWKAAQKQDGIVVSGEQSPNSSVDYDDKSGPTDKFLDKKREAPAEFHTTGFGPEGAHVSGKRGEKYIGPLKNIPQVKWDAFREEATTGAEVFGGPADKFKDLSEKSDSATRAAAAEYANKYKKLLQDRQVFHTQDVTFTARENEEGRSNAKDITEDTQNNIQNRAVYDLDEHKYIPVNGENGKFSDEFQGKVGGRRNITVTGSIDPKNYIAKKLNNSEFADAYTAIIEDPKDPSKTRNVLITRKKFRPGQESGRALDAKAVNHIYSTVNAEPGKEKKLNLFGQSLTAKELIGNQFDDYVKSLTPEEQATVATFNSGMPILVKLPWEEEKNLYDGPEELNQAIKDHVLKQK